jgi:hypothetical protein
MSRDEGYVSQDDYGDACGRYERIGVMLHRLWKTWKTRPGAVPTS